MCSEVSQSSLGLQTWGFRVYAFYWSSIHHHHVPRFIPIVDSLHALALINRGESQKLLHSGESTCVAQDQAQSPDCASFNSKRSRNTDASSNPTREIHFQLKKPTVTASWRSTGGWRGRGWGDEDWLAQPRRFPSSFPKNNENELRKNACGRPKPSQPLPGLRWNQLGSSSLRICIYFAGDSSCEF